MSAHSMIGILNADNTVLGIFCLFYGHFMFNGLLLEQFWKDPEKVKALLVTGSLLELGAQLPTNNSTIAELLNTNIVHADPRVYISRTMGMITDNAKARLYSLNDFVTCEAFNYYFDPVGKRWYCGCQGNVIDLQQFFSDKRYFMSIWQKSLGVAFETEKQKLLQDWDTMQRSKTYNARCLNNEYNIMHNLSAALCKYMNVPEHTYEGAIVKQRSADGDIKEWYIIYDSLQQGQKRRKRLAEDADPLVCVTKAYLELKRRIDVKRKALGIR